MRSSRLCCPRWPSETPSLGDHVDDVGMLAERTAFELGYTPGPAARIRIAAELHDIGKMAIPEAILNKSRSAHGAGVGARCASTRWPESGSSPRPRPWPTSPRSSAPPTSAGTVDGYPDGLAGEQIPHGARIISVCDSYHAMTSDRPIAGR